MSATCDATGVTVRSTAAPIGAGTYLGLEGDVGGESRSFCGYFLCATELLMTNHASGVRTCRAVRTHVRVYEYTYITCWA